MVLQPNIAIISPSQGQFPNSIIKVYDPRQGCKRAKMTEHIWKLRLCSIKFEKLLNLDENFKLGFGYPDLDLPLSFIRSLTIAQLAHYGQIDLSSSNTRVKDNVQLYYLLLIT